MSKILLSGYYGFKNFGDEAILSVLVNHLKTHNSEITVLSGNPDYTKSKHNVTAVNHFDFLKVIEYIKNSDIVISGGGSLLQDVTSLKSLVYYLMIIALGIFFNKKVIIFAQGIGPINNKFAKILTKNLLRKCSYVSVRDSKSLELMQNWNVNADLVCDPVFSLDINQGYNAGKIGIQLRNFETMNYNLLHKLAMLVISKFSDKKVEIFSLQEAIDLKLCQSFQNLLKTLNPEIQSEIVSENILNRISQLEYLFAMRYHAILAALKAGVKTCAINYDIKVEKLAESAQIPIISMDAHENLEKIYAEIINLNKENIKEYCNTNKFDWTKFDEILAP